MDKAPVVAGRSQHEAALSLPACSDGHVVELDALCGRSSKACWTTTSAPAGDDVNGPAKGSLDWSATRDWGLRQWTCKTTGIGDDAGGRETAERGDCNLSCPIIEIKKKTSTNR